MGLFVDGSGRVEAVYRAPRPVPRRSRVGGGAKIKRLTLFRVRKEHVAGFHGDRPREGAGVSRVGFHHHVPWNLLVEVNRHLVVTCSFQVLSVSIVFKL